MNKAKSNSSAYEAVLAITLGLLLVHYFFYPGEVRFLAIIILFVLITLLSSTVANWLAFLWEKLTLGLGWFMSRVLFSAVFYLVLTPIALLYRLFGKDQFYKRPEQDSYFIDRNHQYKAEDVQDPW